MQIILQLTDRARQFSLKVKFSLRGGIVWPLPVLNKWKALQAVQVREKKEK